MASAGWGAQGGSVWRLGRPERHPCVIRRTEGRTASGRPPTRPYAPPFWSWRIWPN